MKMKNEEPVIKCVTPPKTTVCQSATIYFHNQLDHDKLQYLILSCSLECYVFSNIPKLLHHFFIPPCYIIVIFRGKTK